MELATGSWSGFQKNSTASSDRRGRRETAGGSRNLSSFSGGVGGVLARRLGTSMLNPNPWYRNERLGMDGQPYEVRAPDRVDRRVVLLPRPHRARPSGRVGGAEGTQRLGPVEDPGLRVVVVIIDVDRNRR
jgi:hypothetical protein